MADDSNYTGVKRDIKTIISIFWLSVLLFTGHITLAQTNKEKAEDKANKALDLEDEDKYEDAIKLFEEAQKLDPDKIDYPYEIAYCYRQLQNHDMAINVAQKLLDHKDAEDVVYQLLGNSYDDLGRTDKAIQIYEAGLKRFPNSGCLCMEMGVIQMAKKKYEKALDHFEKGIEVQPKFASNYFWATKLYCASTEEVWGMIYGEIFMNLERKSRRTPEISKLLYDTYKSQITFASSTKYNVSFSKSAVMNVADLKDTSKLELPFGMGCYEPTLMFAMINENSIDMNSLDRIRKRFVELYFENENDKKYPNLLFDYQNKILKAGHLEAYNHWVLMSGDEDGFAQWKTANRDKWTAFIKWFGENKIPVSDSNKFYSAQY